MTERDNLTRLAAQARADHAAAAPADDPARTDAEAEHEAELADAYARWLSAQRLGTHRPRNALEHELDVFSRKLERAEANLRHAPDHLASRAERNVERLQEHVDRLAEELGYSRVHVNGDPLPLVVPACLKCGEPIHNGDPYDRRALFGRAGLCDQCLRGFTGTPPSPPHP